MIDLSPGLIGAAIYLLSLLKKYSAINSSEEFLTSNPFLQNVRTTDVLKFAMICNLIIEYDNSIRLTELGSKISELRDSGIKAKRILLFEYIKVTKPPWAALMTKGRAESIPFFADDIKTCFFDAGLMKKTPTDEIVCWWDAVSNTLYGQRSEEKNRIGRQGERLTLDYELHRTGRPGQWEAIESNTLGYDVRSIVDIHDAAPLLIEVKASGTLFSSALAYITRHEWETAQRSRNYRFYLWSIYNGRTRLAVLNVNDIQAHIPQNMGKGHWETVSLNYSTFKNKFEDVDTGLWGSNPFSAVNDRRP